MSVLFSSRLLYRRNCLIVGTVQQSAAFPPGLSCCQLFYRRNCLIVGTVQQSAALSSELSNCRNRPAVSCFPAGTVLLSAVLSSELSNCRYWSAVGCFIAGTALLSEPSSSRLLYRRNCLVVGTVQLSAVLSPELSNCRYCSPVGCFPAGLSRCRLSCGRNFSAAGEDKSRSFVAKDRDVLITAAVFAKQSCGGRMIAPDRRARLFLKPVLSDLPQSEQQFAHRKPFFTGYLQLAEGDPPVGL